MQLKNILIPIGGSNYSKSALHYAIMFAKKFKAELFGIYVKDIRFFKGPWFNFVRNPLMSRPYFKLEKDNISSALDARASKIKDYFISECQYNDVKYSFQILRGLVSDAILDSTRDIDLVIMGKKGEHASWLKRHLGSTSTRVIHKIDKPLLVVEDKMPPEIKKVLLCYAGGYFAKNALELTQYIIEKTKFELYILTIATEKTRAIKVQKEARDYFSSKKINAHYLLTFGELEEEVMKIIKIEEIDILVLGTSLHRSYEDFLSLCLADRILYDSTIPILFVKGKPSNG